MSRTQTNQYYQISASHHHRVLKISRISHQEISQEKFFSNAMSQNYPFALRLKKVYHSLQVRKGISFCFLLYEVLVEDEGLEDKGNIFSGSLNIRHLRVQIRPSKTNKKEPKGSSTLISTTQTKNMLENTNHKSSSTTNEAKLNAQQEFTTLLNVNQLQNAKQES